MNNYLTIQIVILLVFCTQAKVEKLPMVTNDQTISLRINQLIEVDSSFLQFGKLQNIYSKQVAQFIGQQEYPFPTCYQNPPEAHFISTFKQTISDYVPQHGIVYDFQKIKQQRSLIDIATHNQKVYYMLGNGQFKIQTILDGRKFVEPKSYQINSKISKGTIIIMHNAKNGINRGYGLFISQSFAFLFNLQTNQIGIINQYQHAKNFESAIYLEKQFFAVAYGREGMKIFSINFANLTLTLQAYLNKQNSDLQNINDLTYDSDRKIMFILDRKAGVISMQLFFSGDQLFTKQTRSQINLSQCNLIYYDSFSQDLYVNCRELHKYRINNWPMVDYKVLPPQDIFIQEITSIKNVVAFIGREVFQIIYSERKTAVYKSNLLDKLILTQKYFISANQYEIILGSYSIIPPTVSCTTNDKLNLGNHHIILKVTAECNQKYLNRIKYPLDKIVRGDKCVYTACENLKIWEPVSIDTSPFVAAIIVIIALGIAIVIWLVFQFVNYKKLQQNVSHYQDLPEEGRGTFQEQDEKGSSHLSLEMSQKTKQNKQSKENNDQQ